MLFGVSDQLFNHCKAEVDNYLISIHSHQIEENIPALLKIDGDTDQSFDSSEQKTKEYETQKKGWLFHFSFFWNLI